MCFQNNDSSHFIHFLTENPVEEFHEKEGAGTVRYDWGKSDQNYTQNDVKRYNLLSEFFQNCIYYYY